MKRGSVALFREPNTPAAKSRPCVVVQSSAALDSAPKFTVVPLSSTMRNVPDLRPVVVPTEGNGLNRTCEAEVDWIFTFRREQLGAVIGEVDADTMLRIDSALRLWLDL